MTSTAQIVPPPLGADEFSEAIAELSEAIVSSGRTLEILEAVVDRTKARNGGELEERWLLTGFTTDLLMDVSAIVERVMEIRSEIDGGLTESDMRLREAFNA